MNRIQKLDQLWLLFDTAWNNYLENYLKRVEKIREIELMIDTFDSDSEEAKALRRKLMSEDENTEDAQCSSPDQELTLKSYLRLAEKLGNKEKYPTIRERLTKFHQNIENLRNLNESLDIKMKFFTQKILHGN